MLNPFPTAISIKQDAVVGQAEPIEGHPKVIVQEEDKNEEDNYQRVRQIAQETEPRKTLGRMQQGAGSVGKSTGTTVPDHLDDLYEGAACGLNQSEKEQQQDC